MGEGGARPCWTEESAPCSWSTCLLVITPQPRSARCYQWKKHPQRHSQRERLGSDRVLLSRVPLGWQPHCFPDMIREFPPRDRLPPSAPLPRGLPFPSSRRRSGSRASPSRRVRLSGSTFTFALGPATQAAAAAGGRAAGSRSPRYSGAVPGAPRGEGALRRELGAARHPPCPRRRPGGPGRGWGKEGPGAETQAGRVWNRPGPAGRAAGARNGSGPQSLRLRGGRGAGPAARPLRVLSLSLGFAASPRAGARPPDSKLGQREGARVAG